MGSVNNSHATPKGVGDRRTASNTLVHLEHIRFGTFTNFLVNADDN